MALEATATGAAYVEFWADDVKLGQDWTPPYAATWNATAGSHRVAAVANDGQGRDSVWDGHRVVDTHSVTALASQPPPPSVGLLALTRHTLDPGERDSWVVHDSSGTETYPPGGINGDKHATIRWEPGGKYASTRRTYHILGFRVTSGSPGRMFDWHNHPADQPYGWTPPAYPGGPPTGVAPAAIDWFRGSGRGLEYVAEPNDWPSGTGRYHFRILSNQEMDARVGQMVWLWVEITWGRIDGAAPAAGPGRVRVWVAGEDTPRVDTGSINTHYPGQGMVTFWTGTYWTNGAPGRSVVDIAAPRLGLAPQAAYQDNPVVYPDQYGSWGNGLHESLSPISSDVPVPAGLVW